MLVVALALNVAAVSSCSLSPFTPANPHHLALSDVRQSGMLDAEGERNGSRQQR